VREINKGDTKSLYTMEVLSPKDLGSIVNPNIIHCTGTWQYSLFIDKHVFPSKLCFSLDKHLREHTLIFLKYMVNKHIHEFSVTW